MALTILMTKKRTKTMICPRLAAVCQADDPVCPVDLRAPAACPAVRGGGSAPAADCPVRRVGLRVPAHLDPAVQLVQAVVCPAVLVRVRVAAYPARRAVPHVLVDLRRDGLRAVVPLMMKMTKRMMFHLLAAGCPVRVPVVRLQQADRVPAHPAGRVRARPRVPVVVCPERRADHLAGAPVVAPLGRLPVQADRAPQVDRAAVMTMKKISPKAAS